MKAPLSLVPLLPVTIAFGCGIILTKAGVPIWCTGLWLIIGIVLALKQCRYYGALAAALALGQANLWLQQPDEKSLNQLEGENIIQAEVLSVKDTETSQILGVRIIKAGSSTTCLQKIASVKSQIVIPAFVPVIAPGDRLTAKVNLSSPNSIEYFPDQLTYSKILERQNIKISGIVPPDNIYSVEKSSSLLAVFARWKSATQTIIMQSNLNSDTKEFLVTALTGDSRLLDSDTREKFASAGTAHVLALSGLHVGIIMTVCSILLMPLILFPSLRNLRLFLIIIALWCFAFLTGLSPSAIRAVIMATCLLLATMLQRRHSSFNALCLGALVILLFDPEALFSISFQLSFAAVAGILLFGNKLNPVSQRNRRLYVTIGFVTMSVGAMIATGVISGYYFHSFPVYFLLANLLIAPILPPLIGCGAAICLLGALDINPQWLCHLTDILYSWTRGVSDTVSNFPGANIEHIHITPLALGVWIMVVFTFVIWLYSRRKVFATASLICVACFFVVLLTDSRPQANGVYIVPASYRTDIAVCTPEKVTIISTAPPREKEKVRASTTKSFSEYMTNRNIDSLEVVGSEFSNTVVRYNHPLLTVGTHRLLIIDSRPVKLPRCDFDYILICRGYRNTVSHITDKYGSKELIFSADLHPKRLANYIEECNDLGIKYTSLRSEPFSNLLSIP